MKWRFLIWHLPKHMPLPTSFLHFLLTCLLFFPTLSHLLLFHFSSKFSIKQSFLKGSQVLELLIGGGFLSYGLPKPTHYYHIPCFWFGSPLLNLQFLPLQIQFPENKFQLWVGLWALQYGIGPFFSKYRVRICLFRKDWTEGEERINLNRFDDYICCFFERIRK